MVDVALLMRYIPHSCNWGENRRSAASICDLDHSEGNHGSTFPPVRSRPYGLWAKSCGWWTRRRRRRSRRPFGGGCYISPDNTLDAASAQDTELPVTKAEQRSLDAPGSCSSATAT